MPLHKGPIDQEDQDAIILDARAGDIESLKEIFTTLIDPSVLLNCCRDSISGSSALHMAAGNGHLETVKYLMGLVAEYGPERVSEFVNMQNETGNTALHWASLNGHIDVVKCLCDEFGADPFIKNQFGHDALYEAENNGKEEVENYYLKKYDVSPRETQNEVAEGDGNSSSSTAGQVVVSEGTEIESVQQEATEALRESTEKLDINDR